MAAESYRYCKIFLRAAEPGVVMDLLAPLLNAPFQRRTLTLSDATVDVMENSDAWLADDFIGWPVCAEVEAEPGATDAAVVAIASRIVTAMWDAGIPAVAACAYEHELPWRGGLGRVSGEELSADE
jgi:hypothetical protein